jgi:DNA processing protein
MESHKGRQLPNSATLNSDHRAYGETEHESESDLIAAIASSLLPPRVKSQVSQAIQMSRCVETVREVLHSCVNGNQQEAQVILETARQQGIKVISLFSRAYPELLRQSSSPPFVLYLRTERTGNFFDEAALAVVGTRAASVRECEDARLLAEALAERGVHVVSGLALGIDGAAHRGVLGSVRPSATVAVVAHGLTLVYPPSHTRLAESVVAQGGVVVSEYPPGVEARKHHFLERNRIIAGLVRGVVVFKAGERSGSLVTARHAADYGRDVFVYAPQPDDPGHAGGRRLAEDGAQVIRSVGELFEAYGLASADDSGGLAQEYSAEEFERVHRVSQAEQLRMELTNRLIRLPGGRIRVA